MLCQKNGQLAFPLCSVKGHIFVDLQIKEKFIAKSQLLCMKCPLTIERRQMKNPIFVRVCLGECLRLRECLKAQFYWLGGKTGMKNSVCK